MPGVYLGEAAFADLVRIEEFLWRAQDPLVYELIDFIMDAIQVLTHQPGIGRPVENGLRELIISRGRRGFLGRYEFNEITDVVLVARIRHQRESGYAEEEI